MALREEGGVGPKMFQALIWAFGSPENVYDATIEQLADLPRMSTERAEKILSSRHVVTSMSERIERLVEENISVTTFLDDDYPHRLREIDDPPPLLYYRGHLPDPDQKSICIVGTTEATTEGIEAAVGISRALCDTGCTIISGLARGIDTAAHIGAIRSNCATHAVLGSGFYSIYPGENRALASQIQEKGSLISEYAPTEKVNVGRLLARNRIIVGLSDAAVVVQLSRDSSGARSATEACDRQGKLAFYLVSAALQKTSAEPPHNVIPFQTLADIETILNSTFRS